MTAKSLYNLNPLKDSSKPMSRLKLMQKLWENTKKVISKYFVTASWGKIKVPSKKNGHIPLDLI